MYHNLYCLMLSADCLVQTNINNYALAVLLSVNISAYKGDIPRNHILVRVLLVIECYTYFHFRTYSNNIDLICHRASNMITRIGRRLQLMSVIPSLKLEQESRNLYVRISNACKSAYFLLPIDPR